MECRLSDPYILIFEKKVSNLKDLLPLLEKVAKLGKPLMIIAEDVEGLGHSRGEQTPRDDQHLCGQSSWLR